jgi:hypothetical protein
MTPRSKAFHPRPETFPNRYTYSKQKDGGQGGCNPVAEQVGQQVGRTQTGGQFPAGAAIFSGVGLGKEHAPKIVELFGNDQIARELRFRNALAR